MKGREKARDLRFAETIEQIRLDRLQSQAEFAHVLGLHAKTIQGWELGNHKPSWPTLRHLKTRLKRAEWTQVEESLSE